MNTLTITQVREFLVAFTQTVSEYNGGGEEDIFLGFQVDTLDKEKAIDSVMNSLDFFLKNYIPL